jgi:hypothetical protein
LSLNLLNKTVPKSTNKKIAITRHIASNGGVFLRRYTTKIPPQNNIFTKISVGVTVGGYDSRKKFIIKSKKKTSPPTPGAPKQKKISKKKYILCRKKRGGVAKKKRNLS